MHRAAVESILGLHLRAEELFFTHCLPAHWLEAELTLARDNRPMRFFLVRSGPAAALKKRGGCGRATVAGCRAPTLERPAATELLRHSTVTRPPAGPAVITWAPTASALKKTELPVLFQQHFQMIFFIESRYSRR